MEEQTNPTTQTPSEQTPPAAQPAPVTSASTPEVMTTFRKVERVTAWVLIISAILFALIGIGSIWGMFGDNTDIVWRSLGSLSVIALAALVINVGARMAEGKR